MANGLLLFSVMLKNGSTFKACKCFEHGIYGINYCDFFLPQYLLSDQLIKLLEHLYSLLGYFSSATAQPILQFEILSGHKIVSLNYKVLTSAIFLNLLAGQVVETVCMQNFIF